MADFDPLTVPAVMPMAVRRINEGGFPKQALLDYEQALQAWMKSNVANTNTRLNLVSDEVDGAYAAVATEATTRATADSALASSITTVDAKVGNISASGAVYLAAKAAPSGASAAYGWYLTAGSAYAGMEALALSGGGSAIGFTASQFLFTDSGTGVPVLAYSGSKFGFTGNVEINGNLMVTGSIVTAGVAVNAISHTAFSASGGTSTSVVVNVRAGAGVAVTASFNGASGSYFSIATPVGAVTVDRDGTQIGVVGSNFEASGSGPSAGIAFQQTTVLCADYPSAGSHTYTVTTSNGGGVGGVAILVQELAR